MFNPFVDGVEDVSSDEEYFPNGNGEDGSDVDDGSSSDEGVSLGTLHLEESISTEEWLKLFNGSVNTGNDALAITTFESILQELQASPDSTALMSLGLDGSHRLEMPRINDEQVSQMRLRADLDSIMGLVPLEALADCFQSSSGPASVARGFSDHAQSKFHISNGFANSHAHIRGTGFSKKKKAPYYKGMVSTPRVPKPIISEEGAFSIESQAWPFCEQSDRGKATWISLADIPHVLLGNIVGQNGVELKVWWLAPCCEKSVTSGAEVRKAVHLLMHGAKGVLMEEIQVILSFLRQHDFASPDDDDLPERWSTRTRFVYSQTCQWQTLERTGCRLFEEVHDSLISWVLFRDMPSWQTGAASYALTHPALDVLCKLVPALLQNNDFGLSSADGRKLMHSLAYIDGKGFKDKINAVSPTNTLQPDVEPLRRDMQNLLPNLHKTSRGLCRCDVAYEWTFVGEDRGSALLWSIGNQLSLMKCMPTNWMEACRLYNNLGCTDVVDMQAHLLYWLPEPYEAATSGTSILPTHGSLLPPRRGPTYMGLCLPQSALDSLILQESSDQLEDWDKCWCLNIYCTGPRKLASTFGTNWALDFPSLTPYLSALNKVGETALIRRLLMREFETAKCCVNSFRKHVEQETVSQGSWSLRAEVGGRTVDDAVAILDQISRKHQLDNLRTRGRQSTFQQTPHSSRPIILRLDMIGTFMSTYVQQWWDIVQSGVNQSPPTLEAVVIAMWAEQALQSTTLIVKGQNPWCPATLRVLLKNCLVSKRIIFPCHVQDILSSFSQVRLRMHQENGTSTFTMMDSSVVGQTVRAAQRVATMGELLMQSIRRLSSANMETAGDILQDLARYMIATLYSDIWHHMVSKRQWSRNCPVPRVLCQGADTEYSISGGCAILSGSIYNGSNSNQSCVHPSSGPGSRSTSGKRFVERWFPVAGHSKKNVEIGISQAGGLKWYYATIMLWELVRERSSSRDVEKLCQTIVRLLEDPRPLDPQRLGEYTGRVEASAIVPDGTGPTRAFRTNNHWQSVVVGKQEPFRAPAPKAKKHDKKVTVTRLILKHEWKLFQNHSRRGWTDHELDVFSMYVLLEGGEARLNNIDAHPPPRVSIDHISAFVDPRKVLLYCFRLRRSVEGVTCKYNDALKCTQPTRGRWSMFNMLERIKRCLGTSFLDKENRINKTAAMHFLVQNQHKTLEHYRCGWEGLRGPVIDNRNRLEWESHIRTYLNPPIPRNILPIGNQ